MNGSLIEDARVFVVGVRRMLLLVVMLGRDDRSGIESYLWEELTASLTAKTFMQVSVSSASIDVHPPPHDAAHIHHLVPHVSHRY